MHTTEMQKNVIRMRAEGKSIRSIADELEISPTTVCQWNREFTSDIRESHQQELEDVLDGLHATKVQRTRALVKAFKKIELYIQNKEFTPSDLRIYSLLMRLDKYIAQEIMHDVPPLPPKHVCPDPIINVTTDMPIPPPRSNAGIFGSDDRTNADDTLNESIAATSNESEQAETVASDDAYSSHIAPADSELTSVEPFSDRPPYIAKGNHRHLTQSQGRPSAPNPTPGNSTIHQKQFGSPTRDTINIHVDRNRNVTVSKIPKGTSLKNT